MHATAILQRVVVATLTLILTAPAPALAEQVKCQKSVVKELAKYKKVYLKAFAKCLDKDNDSSSFGPCPDSITALKIAKASAKVTDKIPLACTATDLAALGFRGSDCLYRPAGAGVEGACAGLTVSGHDPGEVAACLRCWKTADLAKFVGILYASHAEEVCGGTIDATSGTCADMDCTSPLPDQRDLADESVRICQKAIGKAGVKYLLTREKILEKCALAGGTKDQCKDGMLDPKVPLLLIKAETKQEVAVEAKCKDFSPQAVPPFCCQCGSGNACVAAATRNDCSALPGCDVKDAKTCNLGSLTCDSIPGPGKQITWWEVCPEDDACGTPLATREDMVACMDTSATQIVDRLLCLQFPQNDWCGSPSGAFVE